MTLTDEDFQAISDMVLKVVLEEYSSLIISLINEGFHENYSGNEKIVFYQNENYLKPQDEKEGHYGFGFAGYGKMQKKYLLECKSSNVSSVLIRIFQYDPNIVLKDGGVQRNVLYVKFSNAAVIFLRSEKEIPNIVQNTIGTSRGKENYRIPVLKAQRYTLEEILKKHLLLLIPFYIVTYESCFSEYEKNEEKLETLKWEYKYIKSYLEQLCQDKEIDEYTKYKIYHMSNEVVQCIAKNHPKVEKVVKDIMGECAID